MNTEMERRFTENETEYKQDRPDYWSGYARGLRRGYHGHAFGSEEEHELWQSLGNRQDFASQERGKGYRDGMAAASRNSASWVPPTADQVRRFLKAHNLTGGEAARIAGLSGSNQFRKYTGGENPRPISYAAWFTLWAHVLNIACLQESADAVRQAMDEWI